MALSHISPAEAKKLIDAGAVMVDIREAGERAAASIPGSAHLPLSQLRSAALETNGADKVVFFCRSGMRTAANAAALAGKADCTAYILDGGIDSWRAAGLPVEAAGASAGAAASAPPLDIMRQTQITIGLCVLAGTLLGAFVSPLWFLVPAAFGAGLVFAGATGSCAMAMVIARMPWNQGAPAAGRS